MSEKYWCLFCGKKNGPLFDTAEELYEHMESTVHKTQDGGFVIPTGKVNES